VPRHKFSAIVFCNLDETGNYTIYVHPKIICTKGIEQVGIVNSGGEVLYMQFIIVSLQC
jgi:hypothetical protein